MVGVGIAKDAVIVLFGMILDPCLFDAIRPVQFLQHIDGDRHLRRFLVLGGFGTDRGTAVSTPPSAALAGLTASAPPPASSFFLAVS
jgi:hypothetical protein